MTACSVEHDADCEATHQNKAGCDECALAHQHVIDHDCIVIPFIYSRYMLIVSRIRNVSVSTKYFALYAIILNVTFELHM